VSVDEAIEWLEIESSFRHGQIAAMLREAKEIIQRVRDNPFQTDASDVGRAVKWLEE